MFAIAWFNRFCCGPPPKEVFSEVVVSLEEQPQQPPVISEEKPLVFSEDGYGEEIFLSAASLSIPDPYPVPPPTPYNFVEDSAWAALRVLRATVKLEKIVAANSDLKVSDSE
ncbi:hypothetical protein BSKO_02540 [Bryopsis sp. KO-2023]|nr:hypothetical protein BSKO_02540 [Bryopsis sp. KO-2023]